MTKIIVAVPCLFNAEATRQTIESIGDVDILLIDNGAEKPVKDVINSYKEKKNVTIIHNEKNIYVNPAWNQAAEYFLKTDNDVLCICNSDFILHPQWKEALETSIKKGVVIPTCVDRNFEEVDISQATYTKVDSGTAGFFIVLTRKHVEATFPIPEDIRIWYGDNFIYQGLRELGIETVVSSALQGHHIGSQNVSVLSEASEIIEEDKKNWIKIQPIFDERFKKPKQELEAKFQNACSHPSDINELVPFLHEYAKKCEHVTEMGTRTCVSIFGLLAARPKRLVSYDIGRHPNVSEVEKIAQKNLLDFVFKEEDVLKADIEETDMLFIDTFHTATQLERELAKHAEKVRRYLAFHDIASYWIKGEDSYELVADKATNCGRGLKYAIEPFLENHPEWRVVFRTEINNGLLILERENNLAIDYSIINTCRNLKIEITKQDTNETLKTKISEILADREYKGDERVVVEIKNPSPHQLAQKNIDDLAYSLYKDFTKCMTYIRHGFVEMNEVNRHLSSCPFPTAIEHQGTAIVINVVDSQNNVSCKTEPIEIR